MFRYRLTEEAELRLLLQPHAVALYAQVDRNRAHLRPWLPWVEATRSVDDIRAFIGRSLAKLADNGAFEAGIWCRGELVGVVGLFPIVWGSAWTEIGYWLAAHAQGQGLMTRSVHAVADYAFRTLDLNRLQIRAATDNVRSRAVPSRLGFTHEGTLRQQGCVDGVYHDLEIYGMLRATWEQRYPIIPLAEEEIA